MPSKYCAGGIAKAIPSSQLSDRGIRLECVEIRYSCGSKLSDVEIEFDSGSLKQQNSCHVWSQQKCLYL